MMNRTPNQLALLLSLAILGAGCASKGKGAAEIGDGTSAVTVTGVSYEGNQVNIKTDHEPKYNVFKLSDPDKVVIDIMDAKAGKNLATTVAGSDPVKEIKVQGLEDSLSSIVRVEVFLSAGANYLASFEGDHLAVRIMGSGAGPSDNVATNASPAPSPQTPGAGPAEVNPLPDAMAQTAPVPVPVPDQAVPPLPSPAPAEGEQKPVEGQSLSEAAPTPSPMPENVIPPAEAVPPPPPIPNPSQESQVQPPPGAPVPEAQKDLNATGQLATPPELPNAAPEAGVPPVPPIPGGGENSKVEVVPVPVPGDEKQAQQDSNGKFPEAKPLKKKKRKSKQDDQIPNVATQDIPTTGITEGTSLLSELDNKVYTGKRVTLEFQDADVQDILQLIADVSKLNIIAGEDVKGKLTLRLIDVPWDQALDIVLTTLGLDKVQHGNIIRVAPVEKLKKEREIALANDKAAKQLEPLRLKLINVNYASAEEMSSRIKNMLSDRGTVDTDARTNTMIVKDIREHISRIENLVKALDTQTPQVRIESRIVQANDQFTKSLGIQWGPTLTLDGSNNKQRHFQFPRFIDVNTGPGFPEPTGPKTLSQFAVDALPGSSTGGELGFRLGSVSNIFNLDLHLTYAENEQLARIISRPSISVLNNRTAHIIQGTKIPFLSTGQNGSNVQFQDAGIEITVTPQVTSDGSVIMKLNTRSNEPGGQSVGGNPSILIREATTEMLVKSARTAVLGGVFKTSDTTGKGGVPGLMHIPILGWLFKGENTTTAREETLIFITPYILNDMRTASTAPAAEGDLEP